MTNMIDLDRDEAAAVEGGFQIWCDPPWLPGPTFPTWPGCEFWGS